MPDRRLYQLTYNYYFFNVYYTKFYIEIHRNLNYTILHLFNMKSYFSECEFDNSCKKIHFAGYISMIYTKSCYLNTEQCTYFNRRCFVLYIINVKFCNQYIRNDQINDIKHSNFTPDDSIILLFWRFHILKTLES